MKSNTLNVRKFYITRHCVELGRVYEDDLEIIENTNGNYAKDLDGDIYIVGATCFENKQDAINKANRARQKAIISLQKDIEELEEIDFSEIGKRIL
jgi:hypothetical protein